MAKCLSIESKFNGPHNSGNGGYSAGLLAQYVDGVARVRLASPPPLDTALSVHRLDDNVELRNESVLIATASPSVLTLDIPDAPSLTQAAQASTHYVGFKEHALPKCYVCGPERCAGDGMRLFPGSLSKSEIHACAWSPTSDQLDANGVVRPEIVWAALDCPGYFAIYGADPKPALLGELTANLRDAIFGDQDYVVYAWLVSRAGRKNVAGTAIADRSGYVRAFAKATWIELRA